MADIKMSSQNTAASARLFLAICPPQRLRSALHRFQTECVWERRAALVDPNKLHITLYFLGHVERARLPQIIPVLAVPCMPFRLKLDVVESWPGGVSVLRARKPPIELANLREQLSLRIQELGLVRDDREFRPHITLARNSQEVVWPTQCPDLIWSVDHYELLESMHSSSAPYKLLQKYAMKDE